ncbi:MAG: hypothetical protein LBM71_01495 [Elusimicrobiota bacterium]|jgi:hypothetical protein|nr:hypothetical protein [Elusimicrobiota bacterium]
MKLSSSGAQNKGLSPSTTLVSATALTTDISKDAWQELYQILHTLLERRCYLQPFVKEFDYIDKTLNQYFNGVPFVRIGDYEVKSFCCEASLLELPQNIKAKYLKKEKRWVVEIKKLN